MSVASEVLTIDEIFTAIAYPDADALAAPFSYIGEESKGEGEDEGEGDGGYDHYNPSSFIRGLPTEPPSEIKSFGKESIKEYYWIHQGTPDEDAWHCLGLLKDGHYFYYTASCDYSGFDCQGSMRMFISKDKKKLWEEGLTSWQREMMLADRTA